jgi:hypothetical protein
LEKHAADGSGTPPRGPINSRSGAGDKHAPIAIDTNHLRTTEAAEFGAPHHLIPQVISVA